ncbi:hypothetical protein ACF0H5_001210 [Mactra antiquata]
MYFVLIACFVVTANAANFCCQPDVWEGGLGLIMGTRGTNDAGSYLEGTMSIHVDAVNRITATNQSLTVNDRTTVMQRLVSDYKNNLLYTMTETSCSKQTLGEWRSNCIPDNATESMGYFGLGGESIQVKNYYINYVDYQVFASVTADTCVPVSYDIVGRFGDNEVVQNMVFGDIKPGIADRSVFQVPAQCDDPPTFSTANSVIGRRSTLF